MFNIYEILFTIFNTTLLVLLIVIIYRAFTKSKYSQKEVIRKLNELEKELKKFKDQ